MSSPIGGDRVKQTAEAEHIGPEYTGDNISAKKTANYVWDGNAWQRMTQPGGTAASANTERYDYDDATTIYTATAPVGTAENVTGWTITKYDLTDTNNSSGKVATDVSWTNRATGTYA